MWDRRKRNQMRRTRNRKLTIKRETLRRLASGDLAQAAGGVAGRCTYERSGCAGEPTGGCATGDCDTFRCDSKRESM